ncbi:peptidase inhibitor family I36 protein [Sphaerimonospora mesophila]|uniref:peptidase inhibitor family I36 protein n=1 Tax=Sphaerimonospora mesophila TaxID=37483 RepID=UPI003D731B84
MATAAASVALAAGLVTASPASPAFADSSCASSYFCVWDWPGYTGWYSDAARTQIAIPEWHQSQINLFPFMVWNDESYKNRFTTLEWVCVYEGYYTNPTIWIRKGQSFSSAPSGMTANRGDGHRGRTASQSC